MAADIASFVGPYTLDCARQCKVKDDVMLIELPEGQHHGPDIFVCPWASHGCHRQFLVTQTRADGQVWQQDPLMTPMNPPLTRISPAFKEQTVTTSDRHPGVQNLMRWLRPNPKLPEPQRYVAVRCHNLAESLLVDLDDGPELTEGLRKLLEAKDAFVRASMPPEEPRG